MTFLFWLVLAIAYLLTAAFVFSALLAWRADIAKRKAERLQLARMIAARKLARYSHWPSCNCGFVSVTGSLIHLDARCLLWTDVMRRRIERQRAEKETAREEARAESQTLN